MSHCRNVIVCVYYRGMTQTTPAASGPALSMSPTLWVTVITGPRLDEPVVQVAASRQRHVEDLLEVARDLLSDLLDYVPLAIAEDRHPDPVTVAETLQGYGYSVTAGEREVSL